MQKQSFWTSSSISIGKRFISYAVLPCKGWLYDKLIEARITTKFIDSKGSFNFSYLMQLIKAVRLFKPDIIHSHLFGSNIYCSIVGIITGVPVISTFHGFVDADRNDRTLKLKLMLLNLGSKKFVFVSKRLQTHFIHNLKINSKKAVVIYNGVDTSRFRQGRNNRLRDELGLTPQEIIFGSIGNIRPAKGYDILLQAAARVKQIDRHIRFVVAGEGSGKLWGKLKSLQKELDLADTVFFLGFRENTVELLQGFDYFVLPSISEGFSIATIEAMACGLPIIATRSGGPEEIIENNMNGILIRSGDPEALACSIDSLVRSPEKSDGITACAIKTAENRFSLKKMLHEYEHIYKNVVCNFKKKS